MYTKAVFARRLKSILKSQGITQRDLSHRMNTTETTISRYVSGDRAPDIEAVVKLAQVLHVSTDTLIGAELSAAERPTADADILLNCYSRMTADDKRVLWALLDRYLSPKQRALLDARRPL